MMDESHEESRSSRSSVIRHRCVKVVMKDRSSSKSNQPALWKMEGRECHYSFSVFFLI